MGQFEKIVVLLIGFFLVTVIIVVTFGPSEEKPFGMGPAGEVEAAGKGEPRPGVDSLRASEPPGSELAARDPRPAEGANPRRERERGEAKAPAEEREAEPQSRGLIALREESREDPAAPDTDLLLDSAGTSRPGPRADRLPAGAALLTLEGLEDTFEPDLKQYVWKSGDTFVALAERLYGDARMSKLLRQFNEDRTDVEPGERILVPVFDGRRGSDARSADAGSDEPPSAAHGDLYTVEEGDSLWVISKKVYGVGASWETIYQANRDVLESPDDLDVGMKLRIP